MTTHEFLFHLCEHNGVCVCVCVRGREVYDTVYSKTFTLKNDIMHQLQMFLLLQSFSRCYFLPQSEQGVRGHELVLKPKYQDCEKRDREREEEHWEKADQSYVAIDNTKAAA